MAARRDFDMGRVIDRTFGVVSRNAGVFGLLSLLLTAVPLVAMVVAVQFGMAGIMTAGPVPAWVWSLVIVLGYLCCTYLLQASIVRGALADLTGQPVHFGECLSTGLSNLPPLVGIALISILGIFIGLALLIVPGVFLAVIWLVAGPVRVMERRGVFASLGRSMTLTEGARWPILGLMLVAGIASFALSWLIAQINTMLGAGGMAGVWFQLGLNVAANTVTGVLGAVGVASIYFELRQIRDDIGPDDLVKVFD